MMVICMNMKRTGASCPPVCNGFHLTSNTRLVRIYIDSKLTPTAPLNVVRVSQVMWNSEIDHDVTRVAFDPFLLLSLLLPWSPVQCVTVDRFMLYYIGMKI